MRTALFAMVASTLLITAPAAAQDATEPWEISGAPEGPPPLPPPAPPAPAVTAPPGAPTAASPSAVAAPPEPPPAALVEVMDSSLPERLPTRMNSPGLFVSGLMLSSAGFVGAVTGLGFFFSTPSGCTTECPPLTAEERDRRDLGMGLTVAGGVALALGLPLLFIGGRQVQDKPSWANARPVVLLGARSAAVRWAF